MSVPSLLVSIVSTTTKYLRNVLGGNDSDSIELCGRTARISWFTGSSLVKLRFTSDNYTVAAGFKIGYTTTGRSRYRFCLKTLKT